MRRIIAILVLTLLAQIAKANTSDDLLTSVGALIPNYTNIYAVNMTGGDAYKLWQVTNVMVWYNFLAQGLQLTTSEKNEISTNSGNTTILISGLGSGYGGKDCSAGNPVLNGICTPLSISTCAYYYPYTPAGGIHNCFWVPSGSGMCVQGGQGCAMWPIFQFVFQTLKTNAKSMTFSVTVSAGQGNPAGTDYVALWIYNYTTSAWTYISTSGGPKSTPFAVGYTTTNLTDFMNSSGQVLFGVIGLADSLGGSNIPNMSCFYAQCAVAYNGVVQ